MTNNCFFVIAWIAIALLLVVLSLATPAEAGTNSDTNMPDPNSAVSDKDTEGRLLVTEMKNDHFGGASEDPPETIRRETGVGMLEILALLVGLIGAIAASASASAARKSARMAERVAKAAISYSLIPLVSEISVPFNAAEQIPEGYNVDIQFQNSGNQTVVMHEPEWEAQPRNAVDMSIVKVELYIHDTKLSEPNRPSIPVFAGFTAKVCLRFALGYSFETAKCCTGVVRFPIRPRLDDGSDVIEIPFKFIINKRNDIV
jgi:hypothetical protein